MTDGGPKTPERAASTPHIAEPPVESPAESGGQALTLVSTSGRADLDDQAAELFSGAWPEFIFHDAGVKPFLARVDSYFADWNFYALDGDTLVGACYGVPIRWDGTLDALPGGYTESLARSVLEHEQPDSPPPNTLVVMGAMVRNDGLGKGSAGAILTALRARATGSGLTYVIAPVRPTRKWQYPLATIEDYMAWTREVDGAPFDPWVRTHAKLGATMLAPAPTSQVMTGTVKEWEEWTSMPFPVSGDYVIPDGLTLLHIDREADRGEYREPNIWMRHV